MQDVRKPNFKLNPQLFGEKEKEEENPEKDPKPEEKPEEKQDVVALAKALKEAKENSVSKEEYEKLKEENSKLIGEVINGGGHEPNGDNEVTPEKADEVIDNLKKELYGPNCDQLNNLEYWKKTLALRKAIIDKGEPDPFLPIGNKITPTPDDESKASRVAEVVQQCIDEAEGNSEVFTAILQSRLNPDPATLTARLNKAKKK